jgi:hypothetical protein
MSFLRPSAMFYSLLGVAVLLAACGIGAAHADGSGNVIRASQEPSAIQLTLSTDSQIYRLSDSVLVHLVLRNVSDDQIRIGIAGAVSDTNLNIFASDGRMIRVDPDLPLHILPFSGRMSVLQPGAKVTETKDEGRLWMPLSAWGYRLDTPGAYTLVAKARGFEQHSNSVTISITRPWPRVSFLRRSKRVRPLHCFPRKVDR